MIVQLTIKGNDVINNKVIGFMKKSGKNGEITKLGDDIKNVFKKFEEYSQNNNRN